MSGQGFDPKRGQKRRQYAIDLRPNQSESPFANAPTGLDGSGYLKFLQQNWQLLGWVAYDGYLRDGRGVVVVDWDAMLGSVFPEIAKQNSAFSISLDSRVLTPTFFFGEGGEMFQSMGGKWFSPDWVRLVTKYDPETMIVLAIAWHQCSSMSWMVRTLAIANAQTPKQIFESQPNLDEYSVSSSQN